MKRKKVKNPEATVIKLQIIRYSALIIAVVIALGVVCTGLWAFNKDNESFLQNNGTHSYEESNQELLRVVNKNNPLESDYVPELTQVNGISVNTLAKSALTDLLDSAHKDNVDLSVDYAYVSYEEQDEKFQAEYNRLLENDKLTKVTAEAKAQSVIPRAGNSEHQTGLLVKFRTNESKSFKNTQASKWLERNGAEFGFVLRYSAAKQSKTLMKEDLTVYRYVGIDAAEMMRILDMCLDEYSEYISVRE